MGGMDTLIVILVVVAGLLAGLELAVGAVVNPILDGLGGSTIVRARSSGAGTLGRVMPVVYVSVLVLTALVALLSAPGIERGTLIASLVLQLAILALSLILLVPINNRSARWDPDHPPSDWRDQMRRWDIGHGVRVALLVAAFALLVVGAAA